MKIISKKIFTSFFLVIISIVLFSVPTDAAKKVTLNKSKLSIQLGKKYTLKLKNNKKRAKWKVISGSSNVKLSSKKKSSVIITGIKKGSAKVQAKIGKKKYTCKIKIYNPTAPEFQSVEGKMDWSTGTTRSVFKVTPSKGIYVPSKLVYHNAVVVDSTGLPKYDAPTFNYPIMPSSVNTVKTQKYENEIYYAMTSNTVTYFVTELVTYASNDNGETNFYYNFSLLKDNYVFTYQYNPVEGEYNLRNVSLIK